MSMAAEQAFNYQIAIKAAYNAIKSAELSYLTSLEAIQEAIRNIQTQLVTGNFFSDTQNGKL